MDIRLSHEITKDSIVDGPGFRAVIWTQGCIHKCRGCHNQSTHDFNGGFVMDTEEIKEELRSLRLHKGISLSGGDPFEQPIPCIEIAKEAKSLGLDVWAYTGYNFEELINHKGLIYKEGWKELLEYVDVLVDGPFIMKEKNLLLRFRGSENQRIIDVKKSLAAKVVMIKKEYYDMEEIAMTI
ncbi:MAG: anaerobic ribonucleoside-triphosphate reductase activating protein [Anaeromicrobium sp.]|jgi:anaerobic ribonucleoside-triphosphate reductase activating protein|uniref:anaerobic ribonucleoside-triphosphate reductase activating protein n=1 Tax=Anaeromicrobium sp. TaxID=1929132 RepID=UPI0025CE81FA|nr:anaerobic ribonucleoside-triphosphate reductase activating protein [Anaeromicrobium sp.]MCT4593996.1 anaerobic ribonucleoside-triphosphate reductase activating protein [Anaeromicrobium sp.]